MKIINSIDSAITKGHWHNPGADFYNKICSNKEALKEAYLVIGENVGENVPFTRSGCKYPHHSINKDGDLVLNVAGVKAAYQRAKQMGIFSGEVKEHLMRHYKELDIYKGSQMELDKKITENFEYIESVLGIDENKYFMEWEENSSIDELSTWIDNVAHNGFDEYTEKSHGSLKYCYRIGFNKDTGEQVAVQFALDPEAITAVGDPRQINGAKKLLYNSDLYKSISNDDKAMIAKTGTSDKSIFDKALEKTKESIRKIGMIDFVSSPAKVESIFTKNGKSLNSVKLIPMFSETVEFLVSHARKDLGNMPLRNWFNSEEFKNNIKMFSSESEEYHVGEISGGDKYKTTKLLWDYDLFNSYKFTPVLRGFNKPGKGNDPEAALKYLQKNMIVKPTESVTVKDFNEMISSIFNVEYCWGDSIVKFNYMGESYTFYNVNENIPVDSYFLDIPFNKFGLINECYEKIDNIMNESFMDGYIDNYANDDLYIQKMLNDMDEIQYDKSIQDWRLKSPSQVWKKKLGNCHDQSLYALNSLRQFGLEVGQLFFIELNEGEEVGGNAHTLTWYKKDDKYFWFEHSWENYRGIHGPYESLEELKADVYKSWKKDDDINSKKYGKIEFFDKPHYEIGMTLGEYIDSWNKDDIINESIDDNGIEKQWFITSDDGADNCCIKVKGYNKPMRGRSSMITLKHMLDEWYVMSKRNNGGDYGVPGGGWDKDEDPMDAAIRELHEEVQCNISNVRRMGTLIEYHEDVAQWVKDHVPEKDWWYGYYSAIFVGVYAGVFKGEVEDRDKETGYSFKPLKVVIDRFPKEYQDAIIKYIDNKYYQESVFTEADENDPPELDEQSEDKPEEVKEEPKQEETPAEEPDNDDIMNDNIDEEPPELDEPAEEPQQEEQKEEPKEEEPQKEEKPLSMPKQTDVAEKGKNGVNRKKLYIAFIEWCKEYNSKNTFGSIFDKDIFHNVYPFVPEELRYFYRLANPILCVLAGDLTFFQVSELKMINKNNPNINEMIIFAATNNDLRVFNNKDKKVYLATEENGIKLGQVLGESFDLYIQNMIKKGDILNAPLENSNEE